MTPETTTWDSAVKAAPEVPESRQLADRLEQTMTESIAWWRGQYERARDRGDAIYAELEDLKKRVALLAKQAQELGNVDKPSSY